MINMDQSVNRFSSPLCARYLVIHVDVADVPVRQTGAVHGLAMHWGLGVLGNGEWEVAVLSYEPVESAAHWKRIVEKLLARGVEAIRFVANNEPQIAERHAHAALAGVKGLPSMHRLLHDSLAGLALPDRKPAAAGLGAIRTAVTRRAAQQALAEVAASPWGSRWPALVGEWRSAVERLDPFYALPPRLRRAIRWADGAAEQLHRAVTRAMEHRGPFEDRASAASFLTRTLMRAERLLGRCPDEIEFRFPVPTVESSTRQPDLG